MNEVRYGRVKAGAQSVISHSWNKCSGQLTFRGYPYTTDITLRRLSTSDKDV